MQGPKHSLRTHWFRQKNCANISGDEEQAISRDELPVYTEWMEEYTEWMEEFTITVMLHTFLSCAFTGLFAFFSSIKFQEAFVTLL